MSVCEEGDFLFAEWQMFGFLFRSVCLKTGAVMLAASAEGFFMAENYRGVNTTEGCKEALKDEVTL